MNDVRTTLQRQAAEINPADVDPFTSVERRAGQLRRRRLAVSSGGTVLALGLIATAIAVPVLSDSGGTNSVRPPVASVAPSVSESEDVQRLAAIAQDFARSNGGVINYTAMAVKTKRQAAPNLVTGPGFDDGDDFFLLQISGATFTGNGAKIPPGAKTPTGTELLVVVNAQTFQVTDWQIGDKPTDLSSLGTVFMVPRRAAVAVPANVLTWPTAGYPPVALLEQAKRAYQGTRDTTVVPQVKVVGFAAEYAAVITQMWLPGDKQAETFGYTSIGGESQLKPTVVPGQNIIGMHIPGNDQTEDLFVVGAPNTSKILYADSGKNFAELENHGSARVGVLSRDLTVRNPVDRVRLLDENGKTIVETSVFNLLCGKTGCG